ncbi:helix-turn-helix domain-containing protein [Dankookia rubra]
MPEAALWIEANAQEQINFNLVACQADLSRVHVHRIFTGALRSTPHQYLVRVRPRRAARLPAWESCTVSNAGVEAGLGNVSSVVHNFRRVASLSPKAFRRLACGDRNFLQNRPSGAGKDRRHRRPASPGHLFGPPRRAGPPRCPPAGVRRAVWEAAASFGSPTCCRTASPHPSAPSSSRAWQR